MLNFIHQINKKYNTIKFNIETITNTFFLLIFVTVSLSRVNCSNNRGWAWSCDDLLNIHTEIQDNYGLPTFLKQISTAIIKNAALTEHKSVK